MPRPEQSPHPVASGHRPELRASDAEREQVVEMLRVHGSEGRLGPEELSERLDEAFASQTVGQLERALRELPGRRETRPSPRPARHRRRTALRALPLLALTAIMVSFAVAGLGFLWPVLFAVPWALGMARGGRGGLGLCGHKARRRGRAAAV